MLASIWLLIMFRRQTSIAAHGVLAGGDWWLHERHILLDMT